MLDIVVEMRSTCNILVRVPKGHRELSNLSRNVWRKFLRVLVPVPRETLFVEVAIELGADV